jgi:hypothetical protein
MTGWSVCSGCGLSLPGDSIEALVRRGASDACWQLYGEVVGYEAAHVVRLGQYHQLTVDAYAAQHPVDDGPTIGLAFALIGLHLALDHGWRGDQVRDAHQYLAGSWKQWPTFRPPAHRGKRTVFDVAIAGSPDLHAEAVRAWATDVWQAWRDHRSEIVALTDHRLTPDIRARIAAG